MSDLLASFRGEWLKMTRRPATWAMGLTLAVVLLALGYALLVLLVTVLGNQPPDRPGVQTGTLRPIPRTWLRPTGANRTLLRAPRTVASSHWMAPPCTPLSLAARLTASP